MTWTNDTGKRRDLVFHAFAPAAGRDAWHPIAAGSYAAVADEAHHFAALRRCRVLVIALEMDTRPPDGVTERVLLRMGVPWY